MFFVVVGVLEVEEVGGGGRGFWWWWWWSFWRLRR